MESKVLNCTFMSVATKDAKGGALVSKVEFELTPKNAAYLVDIKGRNCRVEIHPEEDQTVIKFNPEDQEELPMNDGNADVL